MKILVYFSGNLFDNRGTPIRTRNQVKQLLRGGMQVYYAGYIAPEGVDPDQFLLLESPVQRFWQLVRFVRKNSIDIVYIQTSAGIWYAVLLSLVTRARIGVDFHSRRFQEDHVYKKRSLVITAILESVELFLVRFLDFGTGVSHTLKKYYSGSVSNFLVLPVGVDLSIFSPQISPREDIMKWKGDDILIAYAGNTKWYQGIETVLAAFRQIGSGGGYKLLVIASSGSDHIQKYVDREGLTTCAMVLATQPHSEIPGLLAAADVLTVVRPLDLVTEYSFPSKLPEYAALGKCLVASRVSDIERYINDHENGLVVTPGDSGKLKSAFKELKNTELRRKLSVSVRHLAETQFNVDELGAQLCNFFSQFRPIIDFM